MLGDSGFAPKYPVCFIERPWYNIIRAYFLYHLFRRGRTNHLNGRCVRTIFVTVRQPQMQVMVDDSHDFNEVLRVPATQPRHCPYQLEAVPGIFLVAEILHLIHRMSPVIIYVARCLRILIQRIQELLPDAELHRQVMSEHRKPPVRCL